MGVLTDFFVANDDQLATVFPGWLRVGDTPIEREVKNPFTGEIQRIKEWTKGKPVGNGKLADVPDIRQLPHAEWKHIGTVELATLNELLTGKPVRETLDAMSKPALMHPNTDETGLDELPRELTEALRQLSDHSLENIAARWQQTEEIESSGFTVAICNEILQSLRGLVLDAAPDKRIYLLWSL
jgi:hypothetical protein